MSKNENIINQSKKSSNKFTLTVITIIKSIFILLIMGFIIYYISYYCSEIYVKNSFNRTSTGGWCYDEYLNPIYGILGIIIYALTNYFSFLSYNFIISKLKNYKTIIGKIMFILFSFFINILMLIMYSQLFGSYLFENTFLEFFNKIIISFGWVVFPIIFFIIYFGKYDKCKQSP